MNKINYVRCYLSFSYRIVCINFFSYKGKQNDRFLKSYKHWIPKLKDEVDELQESIKIIKPFIHQVIDESIEIIRFRIIFSPTEMLMQHPLNFEDIEIKLKETKNTLLTAMEDMLYSVGL